MSPSWASDSEQVDLDQWRDFDQQLSEAIDVKAVWEYREAFRIDEPCPDTIEAIQDFLVSVRQQLDLDNSES